MLRHEYVCVLSPHQPHSADWLGDVNFAGIFLYFYEHFTYFLRTRSPPPLSTSPLSTDDHARESKREQERERETERERERETESAYRLTVNETLHPILRKRDFLESELTAALHRTRGSSSPNRGHPNSQQQHVGDKQGRTRAAQGWISGDPRRRETGREVESIAGPGIIIRERAQQPAV